MEASLLRPGLDTTLRRGCHALASTDRVAVTVHRCCTAQLVGTEDVTAKVFGTVTRTTDWVSVAIQFDPATGGGADDLSRSIRLAGRIGLGTNHRSFAVGRAGPVTGLCRYAAHEQQDQRDRLNERAAGKHGHFSKALSWAVRSQGATLQAMAAAKLDPDPEFREPEKRPETQDASHALPRSNCHLGEDWETLFLRPSYQGRSILETSWMHDFREPEEVVAPSHIVRYCRILVVRVIEFDG